MNQISSHICVLGNLRIFAALYSFLYLIKISHDVWTKKDQWYFRFPMTQWRYKQVCLLLNPVAQKKTEDMLKMFFGLTLLGALHPEQSARKLIHCFHHNMNENFFAQRSTQILWSLTRNKIGVLKISICLSDDSIIGTKSCSAELVYQVWRQKVVLLLFAVPIFWECCLLTWLL